MFAEFLGFFSELKNAKGEVMSHYEIKKLKDGGNAMQNAWFAIR